MTAIKHNKSYQYINKLYINVCNETLYNNCMTHYFEVEYKKIYGYNI